MNPWTLLGWLALIVGVGYLLIRFTLVVLILMSKWLPERAAKRKRRRALKGKVVCSYVGWDNEALPGQEDIPLYKRQTERVKIVCARPATQVTLRTKAYLCDEHAKSWTYQSDRPRPLVPAPPRPVKTKVIT